MFITHSLSENPVSMTWGQYIIESWTPSVQVSTDLLVYDMNTLLYRDTSKGSVKSVTI